MLASILHSERAIAVNIQIVRIYNKMRDILLNQKEILLKLEKMHNMVVEHDNSIGAIIEFIKQLEREEQKITEQQNRKRIGFKPTDGMD